MSGEEQDEQEEDGRLLIKDVLIEYPKLKPLWKKLRESKAKVKMAYNHYDGSICTITVIRPDGKKIEASFSATITDAAIHGAIREAYSELVGKKAPLDMKAVLDDFEVE